MTRDGDETQIWHLPPAMLVPGEQTPAGGV
jgi:hypothetical protein